MPQNDFTARDVQSIITLARHAPIVTGGDSIDEAQARAILLNRFAVWVNVQFNPQTPPSANADTSAAQPE